METKETGNRKKFQKSYLIVILIAIVTVLVGISILNSRNTTQSTNTQNKIVHEQSGQELSIEIADDDFERMRGFMNRTDIGENDGMLFIFQDKNFRTFWMKDTPTSLDIIFLDENFKVINFFESTLPLQTTQRYSSQLPAMYVLEAKSGFAKRINLQDNDTFELKN